MPNSPYAAVLGARDPQQVIVETPQRLAFLLSGLTPEQAEHRSAPGKWSLREVMCHLVDSEIAWSWRLRLIYEKDNPTLQPFDQHPWGRAYGAYSLAQALATFQALRAWNVAFVSGLSEADKRRPALHPEHGEMTLWTVVETMGGHDLHHLTRLQQQLASE